MKKSINRQKWLQSLKRGNTIWVVSCFVRGLPGEEYIWRETFDGWFDLNGYKGKSCILDSHLGAVKHPKHLIFPTKQCAQIASAPKRIKALTREKEVARRKIKSCDKEIQKLKSKHQKHFNPSSERKSTAL